MKTRLLALTALGLVSLGGCGGHAPGANQGESFSNVTVTSDDLTPPNNVPAAPPARGCQFSGPVAILCSSPQAAVAEYQQYGFDIDTVAKSYSLALISQAQCVAYGDRGPRRIRRLGYFKVATPQGWESVQSLAIGSDDAGFMDSNYLAGTCAQYSVPTAAYRAKTTEPGN
jgi:hypothetical protein